LAQAIVVQAVRPAVQPSGDVSVYFDHLCRDPTQSTTQPAMEQSQHAADTTQNLAPWRRGRRRLADGRPEGSPYGVQDTRSALADAPVHSYYQEGGPSSSGPQRRWQRKQQPPEGRRATEEGSATGVHSMEQVQSGGADARGDDPCIVEPRPSTDLDIPPDASEEAHLANVARASSTLNILRYLQNPSSSPKAARATFRASGFFILHNALMEEACDAMLKRCRQIVGDVLEADAKCHGNRGGGRYSMGAIAASGQQLHCTEWASLLSDPVLDALDSIYGRGGYVLRGGGGEVVLGNVDEYQDLHADVSRQPDFCNSIERPPVTVVNFAIHPIAEDHGPTRILPARGRPRDTERPMKVDDESTDSLWSTLAPLPRGGAWFVTPRSGMGGRQTTEAMHAISRIWNSFRRNTPSMKHLP